MEGWVTKTIGDVITKTPTIDPRKSPNKKIQYVDVSGVSNKTLKVTEATELLGSEAPSRARRVMSEGDVIFATVRPTLKRIAVVPSTLDGEVCSTGYFVFQPNKELYNRYLFYFLQTDYFMGEMEKLQAGASYPAVNDTQVKSTLISYPPIPEQKRIVAILDQAFADIEQARAKTEQNLKNARELFESYLQQVFSQRGEGWIERTLEEISKVGSSKRIYETDWTRSGVPFYGGKEIVKLAKHGSVISNAYISEKKYEEYSSKYDMPQKGDILMTARGTIGVSYIVKEGDKFYYKDGNIISLRPKLNINPQFILYAFKSKQILDQLKNLSGTTVNHLPLRKAKELALYIPDLNAQIDTVNKIKKIEANSHQLIDVYESKLVALDQLKKSILQKAFSGELSKQENSVSTCDQQSEAV